MNEFISTIEQAGLSINQAKAYNTLLHHGALSLTDIAKHSGLKRPNLYHIINRLDELSLVSTTLHGKRTFYSARHPRRLLQIANLRYKYIEDAFPKMVGAYQNSEGKPRIQMFEGIQAVRDVYKDAFESLRAGKELLIFTNIGRVLETFPQVPAEFKKIIGAIIYESNSRELVYGDDRGKAYMKDIESKTGNGYEVRYSPTDIPFGNSEEFIFDGKIIYFALNKHI